MTDREAYRKLYGRLVEVVPFYSLTNYSLTINPNEKINSSNPLFKLLKRQGSIVKFAQ